MTVPPNVPVPVFRVMLTSVLAETSTGFAAASWDCTTIENDAPAAGLLGVTEMIASFEAAPASTVNGALAPAAAAGPLVLVAVITTPLSAFE